LASQKLAGQTNPTRNPNFQIRCEIRIVIDPKFRILRSTYARYEPDFRPKCHFVHPPIASVDAAATLSAQVSGLDAGAHTLNHIVSDLPNASISETLRLASYTAALERNAPGLFYRDIIHGKSSQIRAALRLIATIQPDILALQRFDWDAELRAARAFQAVLNAQGCEMPHLVAPRPNTGVASGVDIDGNGQIGRPGDAQSYGTFAGQRGLLLLSRLPFNAQDSQDHSQVLWANVPQTRSPDPPEIARVQRLAYVAMLQTSINWRQNSISLLTFHASPPVFDGPEDRNGRRNADEITYATALVDQLPKPLVLLANTNLDPIDGEGHNEVMSQLLAHPKLQDPKPASLGGQAAPNTGHRGPARLDTVDWRDPRPGNLRVNYILPSRDFALHDGAVHWPANELPDLQGNSHRLIWQDVSLP
jgi:hypothetical protein